MSLHGDLLDQASRLAVQEPRRPRQASLRRAVSAAYYALFHLLVDAATRHEVLITVGRVEATFAAWHRIRHSPMAILYLGLLSSYDSIRRR